MLLSNIERDTKGKCLIIIFATLMSLVCLLLTGTGMYDIYTYPQYKPTDLSLRNYTVTNVSNAYNGYIDGTYENSDTCSVLVINDIDSNYVYRYLEINYQLNVPVKIYYNIDRKGDCILVGNLNSENNYENGLILTISGLILFFAMICTNIWYLHKQYKCCAHPSNDKVLY